MTIDTTQASSQASSAQGSAPGAARFDPAPRTPSAAAQPRRLDAGGRIDRSRVVNFTFNGKPCQGYHGDTLASALLANGVMLVGRSFKYHRPRGILTCGAEEPNALVQLNQGARTEPNVRATQIELYEGLAAESQNCWPSVGFDVGAVNSVLSRFFPAGFYYKTFMWPKSMWMTYERVIRNAAGLGKAPREPDPDRYDKRHVHCDVLVAGGGPAGLSAALAAARSGGRVVIADEQAEFGGSLLSCRGEIADGAGPEWVAQVLDELQSLPDVTLLPRTQAFGYHDHNYLTLEERVWDHLPAPAPQGTPRRRIWKVRAKQVVIATGAHERPLVFADNDRPGVMLAGAAATYVNRYGVRPGKRAVLFGNNDSIYRAAIDLLDGGVELAAVIDAREHPAGELHGQAVALGVKVLPGYVIAATHGRKRVTGVEVARLNAAGDGLAGDLRKFSCDLVGQSGGWNPAIHLFAQSRGKPVWNEEKCCFVPGEPFEAQWSAGGANGDFVLADCFENGWRAGQDAAKAAGIETIGGKSGAPLARRIAEQPIRPLWLVPGKKPLGRGAKHFLDIQNDSTAADVVLAAREGFISIEHLKRYTTTGMGTDQGKTANVNALAILATVRNEPIPAVGVTTFRQPYTPVTFGAMAGRDFGSLMDPIRRTAIQSWHEKAGAAFEDVGQWRRPFYYPKPGETMHDAVNRECLAVRSQVGMLDASTLGKIDIQGPDSAELLNRIYSNAWSKLEIGRCRYGLMLGEDGFIFDDGVTARLGENHFQMTTTSGNAARVLGWLEEWLQTEWPELKVYCDSNTENWATIAVAGPYARKTLEASGADIDLANAAFPFMSCKFGKIAGVEARIFRVSFSGELSYEINVPANFGLPVWEALFAAGGQYGVIPYGTEAMHVLRADKGFIICGQETDGTVTPDDLGMGWAVKKSRDFIGRRSLSRLEPTRDDRKQLVGLLTEDPNEVLKEGAHVAAQVEPKPPMKMLGHVTSSYYSATMGRSIALALIRNGRDRIGDTVHLPKLTDDDALPTAAGPTTVGPAVAAKVANPVFYDPEGERQNVE